MRKYPILRIMLIVFCSLASVAGYAKVLKIATLSPDGSVWMNLMREGADAVKKETNGRVQIKFYPGGVMGSDRTVMRKMRVGQLHGAAMSSGGLLGVYPDNIVYNLPGKVGTLEEMLHVRKQMDQKIIDGLAKNGLVSFGIAGGGFAYIMSKNPIGSVEDLQTQKVWVPDNDPTTTETVQAFDINPIPLGLGDVLTGLQTGLVNTVAASPVGAIVLQWHTQVKYLTNLPMFYLYATLVVDQRAFKKLKPGDQEIVRREMRKAFAKVDERNRKDDEKAFAALKQLGIKVVDPKQKDVDDWKARSDVYIQSLVKKGQLSQEMLDMLNQSLASYHK